MNKRLIDRPANDLTGTLLRSMREDKASDEAKLKTLAALGLAGSVVVAASTQASLSTAAIKAAGVATAQVSTALSAATVAGKGIGAGSAALVLLKWLCIGAIGSGVALGGTILVKGHLSVRAVASAPVSSTASVGASGDQGTSVAVVASPAAAASVDSAINEDLGAGTLPTSKDRISDRMPVIRPTASVRQAEQEADEKPQTTDSALPSGSLPQALNEALPVPAVNTKQQPSLSEEVAAVDRARQAFAAGSPSATLKELDAYERSAEHPRLRAEASMLRVEALLAQGKRAEATQLGEAILASNPRSPIAPRLRRLLGRDAGP